MESGFGEKRKHRLIDFLLSNYFLLSNPLLQRVWGAPRVFVCLLFYPDSLSKGKEFISMPLISWMAQKVPFPPHSWPWGGC